MDINPLLIPILGISCGLLAIFSSAIVRPWLKLKERQMELDAQNIAEKAAQYAANRGQLEERVAVLERIITDQGYSLAKEIEELRSLPQGQVTPKPDLV
jgi:ABC-type phosphate transport system auxiliary subunit